MPNPGDSDHSTLALSTILEEDFVAPLTAIRGALEILRDFSDLSEEDRARFVATALEQCARLEQGVEDLGSTVYSAGERASALATPGLSEAERKSYAKRIHLLDDCETIEVDFGGFEFSTSQLVNHFYDVLDSLVESSGRRWYFLVNYEGCSIWPEAWVAFARRGKKVNYEYSLGTVRYTHDQQAADRDPAMFESRDLALAHIAELRRSQ